MCESNKTRLRTQKGAISGYAHARQIGKTCAHIAQAKENSFLRQTESSMFFYKSLCTELLIFVIWLLSRAIKIGHALTGAP